MRAWIPLLALSLSGCVFYLGDDDQLYDDDVGDVGDGSWYPDAGPPSVDAAPAACVWPSDPGKVTVCGQILDVATNQPPVEGYAYSVSFYDALDYAANPAAAVPLYAENTSLDYQGNFAAYNVPRPALGFLAVVVDDAPTSNADRYRQTAIAIATTGGGQITYQTAFLIRRDTDAQWSQEIGLPPGPTIVDQGALLQCFNPQQPVAGVTATEAEAVDAEDDFYFADTNPSTRQQLNPTMSATGPNGCVLDLASPLVNHSGIGALEPACWWERKLAAAIPGTLFVSLHAIQCGE